MGKPCFNQKLKVKLKLLFLGSPKILKIKGILTI